MSLIDEIVSDFNERVKQNVEYVVNNIPEEVNYPAVMEDFLFQNVQLQPDAKRWREPSELERINKAYIKLKEKAEDEKLTDTFRTESNTEVKSTSTRSLEKTLSCYKRYHSILQTSG